MVGSSAMVGWSSSSSGGKAVAKEYYLQGRSPESVTADDGKLTLVRNRTATVSRSDRLYLAFELSTDHPQPFLIYAVGYQGSLPSSSPDFKLQEHRDMGSRGFNYASGTHTPHTHHFIHSDALRFLPTGKETLFLLLTGRGSLIWFQRRSLAAAAGRATRGSRARGGTGCCP
jgi:hypothetical protein